MSVLTDKFHNLQVTKSKIIERLSIVKYAQINSINNMQYVVFIFEFHTTTCYQ